MAGAVGQVFVVFAFCVFVGDPDGQRVACGFAFVGAGEDFPGIGLFAGGGVGAFGSAAGEGAIDGGFAHGDVGRHAGDKGADAFAVAFAEEGDADVFSHGVPFCFLSVSVFAFVFVDEGEFFHGGVEAGPAFVCGFGVFQCDGALGRAGGGKAGEGDAVIAEGVDGGGANVSRGDDEAVFCGFRVDAQGAEHGGGGGDAVGFFGAEAADAGEGCAVFCGEDGEGHEEVGGVGEVDGGVCFDGLDVFVDFTVALEAMCGEVFKADAARHFVGDDEGGGVAPVAFYFGACGVDFAFFDDKGIVFFVDGDAGFGYEGGGHVDVGAGDGVFYGEGGGVVLCGGGEEGACGELAGGFGADFCALKGEAACCFDGPGVCDVYALFF